MQKRNGFSYVEVLIALAIVGICLVSLLGLHITQIRAAGYTTRTRRAWMLADEKLSEKLTTTNLTPGSNSGTERINNITYNWQTTIARPSLKQLSSDYLENLWEIKVTVTWGSDRFGNIELLTLVHNQSQL